MRPTLNCTVAGCAEKHVAKGLCSTHYARVKRTGNLVVGPYSPRGGGSLRRDGYISIQSNKVSKLAHIAVAEKALGKPLPKGAEVHHVDGNRSNNAPGNLVICPDKAYHMLLHQRMRAMEACGNPNWRCCRFCGKYDDPANLYVQKSPGRLANHRHCQLQYHNQRKLSHEPKAI